LGLEFGDLSVEITDSSGLRLSTPQQNRGDNADWGLEFLDLAAGGGAGTGDSWGAAA
jgi:hypothetical protein